MRANEIWHSRIALLTEEHARRVLRVGLSIEEQASNEGMFNVYSFAEHRGVICRHPEWPDNSNWVYRLVPFGDIVIEDESIAGTMLRVILRAIGAEWRADDYRDSNYGEEA